MPKICYRAKKFSEDRTDKINKTNAIIEEYKAQGYELTLRQLYYQFVSRNYIPNNMREYKNLGDIVNDARLAGLVDWEAIVDLTRELKAQPCWGSPAEIISACASQFRIDKWARQPNRVEVWIEKDSVSNIVKPTCEALGIAYFSCRGYTSQSEMWEAAQRLRRYSEGGQPPIVFHLGDHDPSGIDMTRDILARLEEFSGVDIELQRLALNMDQITQYGPPPNPAKLTDSRAEGYIAKHGNESWELDALTPEVMSGIINNAVIGVRDADLWAEAKAEEEMHRVQLGQVSDKWDEITENL